MKKIFSHDKDQRNDEIEIDNYLNEAVTPILAETADIYLWWRSNRTTFPILSRIACKYLSIPATSVPSKQLFSNAGNQVTNKRISLAPETIN